MLYFIFNNTKPATSICVSNLKDEIENATLANFRDNVKYLINKMSSNYFIIIDKLELRKDYVCHIFIDILSGANSDFNSFVEKTKDDWGIGTEVQAR